MKHKKRLMVIALSFVLIFSQNVYAAEGLGLTSFFSDLISGIQNVFSGIQNTPDNDTYDLPIEYNTPELNAPAAPEPSTDIPTLTAGTSVSINVTFRGNGGRWGTSGEDSQNRTVTINTQDLNTGFDDTQVINLYTEDVLGSGATELKYFNDDQSSNERQSDADHVIFIGWSESSVGPIIRTTKYQPQSENVELWAQWYYVEDPNADFTITYNAGIGKFRTSASSDQKIIEKTAHCGSYAPDMVTPYVTDANNKFVGWYLETEAGELPSSSTYIMPSATKVYRNMTFTARFTYDDTNTYEYYVKFVSNGGQFSNGDQYRMVKVTRDEPGVLPDEPVRDGYTFNGWSLNASSTEGLLGVFPNPYNGAPDAEDAAQHTADNPFVYYACWYGESQGVTRDVTVTLQPNGGTFGVLTDGWVLDGNGFCYMTSTIVNTGAVTVDLSTFPAISREGYTFKGWSIDGGATAYTGNTYTTSYSCAFVAMWVSNSSSADDPSGGGTSSETHIITFNANGGRYPDGETTSQVTVAHNAPIAYPADEPTRDAYTFAGYATSKDATEPSSLGTLRVTGNVTLYAVWNLKDVGIPTQVQLVMSDGAYNGKTGTSTVITDIGTPVSQFYSKAKRSGYVLKGYASEPNTTDVMPQTTLVEDNMVLYAVWLAGEDPDDPEPTEVVNVYEITFNGNGGYYDNDITHLTYTINVEDGDTIDSIPTPKLDNATFLGYGSEINSTAVLDLTKVKPEADSTYYAVWDTDDATYKVTFIAGDTYGGSKFNGGSQTKEVSVKSNEKVTQPEVPLETPKLTFSYWSETKAASWTGTSSVAFDFNTTIKKNTTLYAIYRSQDNSSKFRTVTFDYNGGKLRTKESVSVNVLYNYPVDKPESPKWKDHTFKGWYTDTAGDSEDKWDFSSPVTEDMTLYAVWKDKGSSKSSTSSSSSSAQATTSSVSNPSGPIYSQTDVTQPANMAAGTNGTTATAAGGEDSVSATGGTASKIPRTGIPYPVNTLWGTVAICCILGITIICYSKKKKRES